MELSIPNRITNKSPSPIPRAALIPTRRRNNQQPLLSTHRRRQIGLKMNPLAPTCASSLFQANGSPTTAESPFETVGARIGEIKRVTKETNVAVKINLDGVGLADSNTGIPFLDHMLDMLDVFLSTKSKLAKKNIGMGVVLKSYLDGIGLADSCTGIPFLDRMLDQLASHGLFDVHVKATGDIHIDDHHTNEDVALAIGTALLQALGERKGINRFGDFSAPLDEALVHVALDLSGRPHLGYDLCIPTERVGTYDTQLVEHFFQSLVNTSGMTLHIRQLAGKNSHHIIEATFKAFARALRQATEYDPRRRGSVPSSKGVLSRS